MLLLGAVMAMGCSDGDEKITVYSGRSQNLIGPLLEMFAEETGINVQVRYGGSTDLALLLQEEGDRTPADVFISRSPGPIGFLAERDLLSELDDEVLGLAPSSPSGYWVALTGRQRVLVYNKELFDPADLPTSIHELTEEKWLGRVALAPTNGSFQDFFTLFRISAGDDKALAWLKSLHDGGAPVYPNNVSIVQAVARGEIEMGLVNHYYNLRIKVEDPSVLSENHNFQEGDPGGVTIATAIGAIASGDKDLAQELIRFLTSKVAQEYFGQANFEYPLATGIELEGVAQSPVPIDLGEFDRLGTSLKRTIELIREAGFEP
ncbi:MAG: iron ABC transporter substrate-binding protein [Dehalococcoidia bacterium]|nr:iron ABC transporter substrate-binding protein [Dehalococcoidia bacterium]HCU99636.1 iron ABC transporter substrate-binding protein [Dehalococcoidia bacterium]